METEMIQGNIEKKILKVASKSMCVTFIISSDFLNCKYRQPLLLFPVLIFQIEI